MTAGPLAIRARGREAHVLAEPALAEIERAGDAASLAAALERAGLVAEPTPEAVERSARARLTADLAILARWARARPAALAAVTLDEDRRSVRAIARGLAADVTPDRRRDGCIPTASLPEPALVALAAAPRAPRRRMLRSTSTSASSSTPRTPRPRCCSPRAARRSSPRKRSSRAARACHVRCSSPRRRGRSS